MDCSCEINVDDADGPTFATEELRWAAKRHWCCECRRKISPGELYENTRGMWDGKFETYKTCYDCRSVRRTMFKRGWTYEMIWEDIQDLIWENWGLDESCLAKATPRARAKLCAILEEFWENQDD